MCILLSGDDKMDNKLLNDYLDSNHNKKPFINGFITRLLITIMIVLLSLIYVKNDNNHLNLFKKYVFEDTFKFSSFNNLYNSLKGNKQEVLPVISNVKYTNKSKYLDGISLQVNDNLVETFKSGIVVFIGDKDGYANTVIVQGSDGYDIWYSNLEDISVSLYDYINANTIIGQTNKVYLKILKDGKNINVNEYLNL